MNKIKKRGAKEIETFRTLIVVSVRMRVCVCMCDNRANIPFFIHGDQKLRL